MTKAVSKTRWLKRLQPPPHRSRSRHQSIAAKAVQPSLVTENIWFHLAMMGLLTGQIVSRLVRGRCDRRNMMEHLACAGPDAMMPVVLTNFFAGMIFATQSAREMIRYGLIGQVGGAFAIGYIGELAPILTAAVFACQVGSAFAAEIASMKLTEQIDALKLLRADPIDYLVMPRVLACALMLPFLTIIGLFVGILGGLLITGVLYNVTTLTFLDGVRSSLAITDVLSVLGKASLFGGAMAITSCSRGLTASCHGKGVGRSVTSAVVISWIVLFVIDFLVTVTLIVLGN